MPILAIEKVGQPANASLGYIDDGEVKHVNDFAVKPPCIMKNLSVKHAVDNVAQSSRGDEGKSKQHTEFCSFLREAEQKINQGDYRHNSEDAECGFDNASAAHPAKSHPRVLDEEQLEPVAQHGDFLSDGHVCLDPDLQQLIQD